MHFGRLHPASSGPWRGSKKSAEIGRWAYVVLIAEAEKRSFAWATISEDWRSDSARGNSGCRPVFYWITSSVRPSTEGGIVRSSALAVLRLMTSSNFVGCSIGRSAGLAPFSILST